MSYTTKILQQVLEIQEVTSIVVTDTQYDETTSTYWREIRVFAKENTDDPDAVVASFRLRGASSDAIHIDVPASQF